MGEYHLFSTFREEVTIMPVSKEEREAYNSGQEEKDYIRDHPMGYLLTGGVNSRPDDPKLAAAYDKGLDGEQLDGDKK